MELIDTHCHIYYDKYQDIDEVVDRAIENNISKMICVGVDILFSIARSTTSSISWYLS
jgi:Tat protein secretion system quality control protein TatD with DNase activity